MNIKLKIISYCLGLLLLAIAITMSVSLYFFDKGLKQQTVFFRDYLSEAYNKRIQAGSSVLMEMIENDVRTLEYKTAFLCKNSAVRNGILRGQWDSLSHILERMCMQNMITFAVLYDDKGICQLSFPKKLPPYYPKSNFLAWPQHFLFKPYIQDRDITKAPVSTCFENWASTGNNTNETELVAIATGIIPNDYYDEPVGYAVIGLSGAWFKNLVHDFSRYTDQYALITAERTPIAWAGFKNTGDNASQAWNSQVCVNKMSFTNNTPIHIDFANEGCFGQNIPLHDSQGQTSATIFTGEPASRITDICAVIETQGHMNRQRMILSTLMVVIIAGALASILMFIIGGNIARPIRLAAHISTKIAAGDFAHKLENTAKDETGILARSMNSMIKSLQMLTEKTERQMEALNQTNTELKQQTQLAQKMASEAQAANIAKREFLANMSHEIRTPMNGVIGMTSLLLNSDLSTAQRSYAESVSVSAESLLRLINDILDFSKIESGKLELEILDFNLYDLFSDCADMMALKAYNKGLEFIYFISPEIPQLLRGDPGRLQQILINLTGNAIKFTQQGEIEVRVDLLDETASDVTLRFSVCDTGIGIPKEQQGKHNRLFDQFTQLDASTTRKYGGTGLGLAISQQLAELMHGEIGVNSEEGIGSEFWFTARFNKQAIQPEKAVIPVEIRGIRILVVDDNSTNRQILRLQLLSWETRPDEVSNANDALQHMRDAVTAGDPYQVAILDHQMPNMDGGSLGQTIKVDSQLKDTILVMMTSLDSQGDAQKFRNLGFAAYLTKPVHQSALYDILATTLAGGTSRTHLKHDFDVLSKKLNTSGHILVAEDNSINQQVALEMLRKLGMRADAVANGLEVIESLKSIPYDLIFMDCQMPEMNGYEAAQRIRDKETNILNHEIPIIAMTAHAMQGDREKCLAAGMNDYLSKPLEPKLLIHALEKWLPKKQHQATDITDIAEASSLANQTKPETNTATLNLKRAKSRLMDDDNLVQMVVNEFLKTTPKDIEKLKQFIATDDTENIEMQAHTIKSAVAAIGAERMRDIAYRIEKAGHQGNIESAMTAVQELEKNFDEVCAELKKTHYGKGQ